MIIENKKVIISLFLLSFIVDATDSSRFPFDKIEYVQFEIKIGFMGPFQDTSGREYCKKIDTNKKDFGTGGLNFTYMDFDNCFWRKLLSESYSKKLKKLARLSEGTVPEDYKIRINVVCLDDTLRTRLELSNTIKLIFLGKKEDWIFDLNEENQRKFENRINLIYERTKLRIDKKYKRHKESK